MKALQYEYNGEYYTISQLAAMSNNLSAETIRTRIKDGWDIDLVLSIPSGEVDVDPKWKGKTLEIMFTEPVPTVFAKMQPLLNKTYIARPSTRIRTYEKARSYYIITLENGKPLIVYPNEFHILAEAKAGA